LLDLIKRLGFEQLTISDGEDSVTIDARCVWCRQDGMFSHTVGVAFEADSLNEQRDETLGRLAQRHARAPEGLDDPRADGR